MAVKINNKSHHKGKRLYSSLWEIHHRVSEHHLPYGITQCHLSPETGKRTPP